MFLPTLIVLFVSLCNAADRFYPHGITLAPRAINTSIPTITLSPVRNQSLPHNLSVTVTSAQMELITNVPSLNGDALLALGSDAAANLETVYQENCPKGLDSPNCAASLQAAISVDQQILEKRALPVLAAIVAVVLAIEYAVLRNDETSISSIRIPSPNLAKISPYQGLSTVVFATETIGGNLITAVPSPTVTGSFTIATVTADGTNAHKGDLIFEMPEEPGYTLLQYVRTYGKCDISSGRKCNEFTLAGDIAGQAIGQVAPGGALSALSTISPDLPLGDPIPDLMQQLTWVKGFGMHVAVLAANTTLLNFVAKFLLFAVYAELTTQQPNPTQLIVPASDIATSAIPSATAARKCPTYPPNCSNCGGNKKALSDPTNTVGICVGIATLDGYPEGCACVDPYDPPLNTPFDNMTEIQEAQAFLNSIADGTIKESIACPQVKMFDDGLDCKYNCPSTCKAITPKPAHGCVACEAGDTQWQCLC